MRFGIVLAAFVALVAGCTVAPRAGTEVPGGMQMYAGEAVADHASLRSDEPAIRIWRIDGFTPNSIPVLFSAESYAMVGKPIQANHFLLPGRHEILVVWKEPRYQAIRAEMWFIADPGVRYVVRAMQQGRRIGFVIQDESTGRPVGGYLGGESPSKGDD